MHALTVWIRVCPLVAALLAGIPGGLALATSSQDLDSIKIASTRKGPCDVTVRRTSIVHIIEITGLDPDEAFDLVLTYEGRRLTIPVVVASKGVVIVALESKVKGESVGVGYVDFESNRCRVHLSYPWRSKT